MFLMLILMVYQICTLNTTCLKERKPNTVSHLGRPPFGEAIILLHIYSLAFHEPIFLQQRSTKLEAVFCSCQHSS